MPIASPVSPADPYLELVRAFPLRPIRTRTAHARAKVVFRSLVGNRTPEGRDYKAVLVSLIAEYERTAGFGGEGGKLQMECVRLKHVGPVPGGCLGARGGVWRRTLTIPLLIA